MAFCLIDGKPEKANPITFEDLDADAIRQAALHTIGAAGPLGWMPMLGENSARHLSLSNSLCICFLPLNPAW